MSSDTPAAEIMAKATIGLSLERRGRIAQAWQSVIAERDAALRAQLADALEESWNEYLARVCPRMVEQGQLREMFGMFIFVLDYPAALDHEHIAEAVRRHLGPIGEAAYRDAVAQFEAALGSDS